MLPILRTLTALLLATTAAAQVVVVDDDGGAGVDFTSIQAAVDASSDGAIVLVRSGQYGAVTVSGKAVSVIADAGADVDLGALKVQSLSSAQVVNLAGLDIHANFGGIGLDLISNDGAVILDDCTVVGDGVPLFQTNHGARLLNCAKVVMSGCTLSVTSSSGPYSGVLSSGSHLVLYDCSVFAGHGTFQNIDGQPGAVLSGGTLFASGSNFVGGTGADGFPTPPFIPCSDGRDGGAGLQVVGASTTARVLDCSFTGGAAGQPNDAPCVAGSDGPPTEVLSGTLISLPHDARHYSVTSPVVEGDPSSLTFEGQPGDFVWVFYDLVPTGVFIKSAKGVLVPVGFDLYLGGPLPASGALTVDFAAPDVPPGFPPIYEQALFWNSSSKLVLGTPRLRLYLDG